ncbi:MAG: RluA family pseudouridine synthase [Muribaculaceae bacterium]|nr:RluA family pseudouridine synthase [Muribaculaceae bacterium]MDE6754750.1 RluA family pseudouridine synthase [Muribaculaceae bacterium]
MTFRNDSENEEPLLEFVASKIKDKSRNDLKKWLKYGHFMVDGTVTSAFNEPIRPGGEVRINFSRPFVVLRHPRLQLVYEDDDVIVINKGYGLLSVGTQSHKKEETAYDILREYVKKQNPANKLYVVHRLDRDTSGLMMFAKTEEAQETLRHNWNNMVLERLYVALLEGSVKEDTGFVKSRLMENSQFVVYSTQSPEEGKLALTRFKVLKRANGLSLVEFSLDTGRKNQIRVHASEMGHPIMGDRKYGAKESRLNRLCLHARTLRFAHPITRKDMHFETPIPSRFMNAVKTS